MRSEPVNESHPVVRSADASRSAAFSLLELLATLAILSVAAGSAILVWPRVDAALQLDAGLHQLATDLQAARSLAIASASRVRLVFQSETDTYRRERADDAGIYRTEARRVLPRGITVADVNSGGDLAFSPRGQAENGTIVLADGRGVRRALRLNQRGRITILAAGL